MSVSPGRGQILVAEFHHDGSSALVLHELGEDGGGGGGAPASPSAGAATPGGGTGGRRRRRAIAGVELGSGPVVALNFTPDGRHFLVASAGPDVTLSYVAFPNTTAVSAPIDVRAPPASGFAVLAPQNGSSFFLFTAVNGANTLNVSYAGFGADAAGAAALRIAPAAGGDATLIATGLLGAGASLAWKNTSWLQPNTWYSITACSVPAPAVCASSLVLALGGPTYGLRLLSPNVDTWYRGSPVVVTWQAFHPYITFSTLVIRSCTAL
jgi:hypothetical protein